MKRKKKTAEGEFRANSKVPTMTSSSHGSQSGISESFTNEEDLEMVYITDDTGVICSVEDSVWNSFILKNADLGLCPTSNGLMFPLVIGRSLFEYIGDIKVQSFFRHLMIMVSFINSVADLSYVAVFVSVTNTTGFAIPQIFSESSQ